jgi:hypothetical protein
MGIQIAGTLGSQGFVLCTRLLVGSVLLMAGAAKLPQRGTFAHDVQQYRLLPSRIASGYARLLPWAELAAAMSLLSGVLVALGAGVAALLFASFAIAAVSAIARHLSLSCACFGLLYHEKIGWGTVVRDAVLLSMAIEALLFDRGRFSLPEVLAHLGRPASLLALSAVVLVTAASLLPAVHTMRPRAPLPPAPSGTGGG